MRVSISAFIAGWMVLFVGCTATQKHILSVTSSPPDALVSIYATEQANDSQIKKIAGTTPLTKEFEFDKDKQLWFEFEKRGFQLQRIAVDSSKAALDVSLDRAVQGDGASASQYVFPKISRVLVVKPKFDVIQRGFSAETVSPEHSEQAQSALVEGVERYFDGRYQVDLMKPDADPRRVRVLWREVQNALEFVDPIRLKYQPQPVVLGTKGSLSAAKHLGQQYSAEVILFLIGKQNVETGGMLAGKIGMSVIGTANSYASGYSRAMERGDSFFVYNVHNPHFAEGTELNAVMLNCRNGEIVWANKGGWPPVAFAAQEAVDPVLMDLFWGLK